VNLLVTGGAGFIGSNFVRRTLVTAADKIEKLTVLDSLTYAGNLANLESVENNSKLHFFQGDICDKDLVRKVIEYVDVIINFAAESHVDRSINSSSEFVKTNVLGVQNLLDAILASERKMRFIQISTDEVYGSITSGSWSEESPLLPNSPYSASKAGGELLAMAYNKTHGLDVVVTRCSNNYGKFHHPEKLIPLFITNILEGKKVPIYGNGLNVRDWLHVDDHCDAILSAIENGRSGNVYNIGGGIELTNLQITQKILEFMSEDESLIEFVEDRKGHDHRYSVDWSKSHIELNFKPKINFEKGLKETIEWYRENENWWRPLKKI
jgi:dTDP-glucose 4,6-dehydratase